MQNSKKHDELLDLIMKTREVEGKNHIPEIMAKA